MESLITIATRVCIAHFIGHLQLSPEILQTRLQFPVILGQIAPKLHLPIFHYNKYCVNIGILVIANISFSETQNFQKVLTNLVTSMENFKQAPSFIFIHISISKLTEEKNLLSLSGMFAIDWLEFSITAEIYVYDESSIFKINLGCSNGHLPIQCQILSKCNFIVSIGGDFQINSLNIPDNFNKYVFNLKDLFGMSIFSPAESDCSLTISSHYLRNSPQECTLTVFHNLLNLSSFNSGTMSLTPSKATFSYTALSNSVSLFLNAIPWKLKFISYGFSIESFEFVMMTRLNSASAEAFIYPFGISVWICMLAGFLLLFGFLSSMQKFKSVPYTLFWIIATFTLQINSKFAIKIRNDFGSCQGYLIVLWILFIFIVGFFYQGSLLSFLIMKSTPKVPLTLREATKQKFPLISTEKYLFGIVYLSTLNNLAYYLSLAAKSNQDDQLVEFLNTLMATAIFLPNKSSIFETANSLNQFGLIDPPESLNRVTKLVTLLNPELVAVKNYDINPFASSSAWIMQPNILYMKFSKIIGSLISSGLYNTWKLNYRKAKQFSALRNANVNSSGDKSMGTLNVISEGRIFNWANRDEHSLGGGLRQDMLSEAQSVPMEVMIYPLIVFSLFSLVSITTFLLERIVNYFQRRSVQNLNHKIIRRLRSLNVFWQQLKNSIGINFIGIDDRSQICIYLPTKKV